MPPIVPVSRTGFRVGTVPEPLRRAIRDANRRAVIDRAAFQALKDRGRIYAFSVAGDLSNRSIQTILRAAMGNITAGQPFKNFQRSLSPEIFNKITAPEVVYRNAAANAYQRGRFNQQSRVKQFRPFLMYVTFRDDRVRPNHAIMEGVVSPQGSTFWASNYPPNGHLCRCIARAMSRRQVGNKRVFKSQAEVDRFKINQQLKRGVPKSKTVRPIADKQFQSSFIPNEAAAQIFVDAFKTFNRSKWTSIFSPIRPPAKKLKAIAAEKPVTKPDITKFTPAKTIDDAKAYTESIIAEGNKAGYVIDPKTKLPYRRFFRERDLTNAQQIDKYFGKVFYTDDISLDTLNRINKELFKLNKRAKKLGIPPLRGLILETDISGAGAIGDGVMTLNVSVFEMKPPSTFTSAWKKGNVIGDPSVERRPIVTRKYFHGDQYGEAIFEHEFAHHIHQVIDKQVIFGRATLSEGKLARARTAWQKKRARIQLEKREFSASSYAEKNPREWFAENYRLWTLGKKDLVDTPLKPLFRNLDAGNGFTF